MYILGAFDKEGVYSTPNAAAKGADYTCIDCGGRVMLRQGKVRRAHFAHYSGACSCYSSPNESQLHKDVKLKMAELLKHKRSIKVRRICKDCNLTRSMHEIEHLNGDSVQIEFRDPNNKFVADVAVVNDGRIRYIFEIMHTHATTTQVRPEPWFEITVEEMFQHDLDADNIELLDNRDDACLGCRKWTSQENWIANLPSLQDIPFLRNNGTPLHGAQNLHRTSSQQFPCLLCWKERWITS